MKTLMLGCTLVFALSLWVIETEYAESTVAMRAMEERNIASAKEYNQILRDMKRTDREAAQYGIYPIDWEVFCIDTTRVLD